MWSRVDDNIPHHPKFLKAGPVASWLWICGNCYCNRYLTDGFISHEVLSTLGNVPKPEKHATLLVICGLWEATDGGYIVHDFHDHNPKSGDVKAKREADRKRKESGRNPRGIQPESQGNPESPARAIPIPSQSHPNPKEQTQETRSRVPEPSAYVNGTTDPVIGTRAAHFLERYSELYPEHRNGARFLPKPALDWPAACELVQVWPDDRLEKLAIVFLKTDHEFAVNGSRTIRQFAALASWCDDRLRQVEKERGR